MKETGLTNPGMTLPIAHILQVREGCALAPHLASTTTMPKAKVPFIGRTNEPSSFASNRLQREFKTISAMVRIYCHNHHGTALCHDCSGLLAYARLRLERCRFGAEKPTCAKCPVHCYQRDRREQVRSVMRYAGPRMLWKHPLLSLYHWLDS